MALFDAGSSLEGMAFIVVQHLDPKSESHLVDLLSRHTSLRVRPAQDGLAIEPNHVYVCIPNRDLVVKDGHLRLLDTEAERSQRRPIDRLYDSMASEYGDCAIAIILSGTASDGSRGISAIKTEGGMVIVQDPETAEYDGMPRNAISTGLVDLVLPIAEMPEVLQRLAARPRVDCIAERGREPDGGKSGADESDDDSATLQSILSLLHSQFDYDFADYKRPTLLRRTQRRMSLRNVDDFDSYARIVRDDPTEAAALYRDLMINVSSFFRDPKAWEELNKQVVEPLVARRENGEEIRVWSAGCATGEEAYTIAMILAEAIDRSGKHIKPQVFATDVSDSLEVARAGVYPDTIAAQVSQERLTRFFIARDSHYEVKKNLRDMIVFARHNVIRDPPFSRMDMIICRNLLIYIEPDTQRRILGMFNFALRDGGTLFLGSAETIGMQGELFEPLSAPWRIFRSRRVVHAGRFDFPRFSVTDQRRRPPGQPRGFHPERDEYQTMAHRALLDRYAPPSVVIDADHQVLVYHGNTSRYLSQPGGKPTRDLLALVSPGLRPPLRHAILEANSERRSATTTNAYLKEGERRRPVTLTVSPISRSRDESPLLLVSFEEPTAPADAATRESADDDGRGQSGQTVDHLEEELRVTRQDLREVSEQYDRLIEEYSTSNEEMLSINEELQSANEELETSKEELQSLNEELNTLNNELRSKVEAVEQTNNDLNNLLASTEVATLFLDTSCRIRWFTPAIKQVLRLIPSDIGRPISDLASIVTGSELEPASKKVLETLVPVEAEVDSEQGQSYIRRVLPYRTAENRIDGVVVTFVEITEHKKGERQRERLMHELSHRIKNTLATVQAIIQALGQRCASLPEFLAEFEPRLAALARAHSLLTQPGDEGVELSAMINRELDPYVGKASPRIIIGGGHLVVSRGSAIALELVFHELVTNAVKYGALSNETGTIAVRWERIDQESHSHARIRWVESGGPPITSVGKRGFGSLLIESSITHDLAGTVDLQFLSSGLQCTIEFPIVKGESHEDDKEAARGSQVPGGRD
ncbi:MAG: PAS domain-containing protein [Phycisphaerales bacterium]|nr:PAS domain-containing protein [Phycisphaerales bacterium]